MKMLTYAGIGSRKTPHEMQSVMKSIAGQLAPNWTLRSGYALGADQAFGEGAYKAGGKFEMFLPWDGYNDAPQDDPRFITMKPSVPLVNIAANAHPNWEMLQPSWKLLHARNVPIVLGRDLNDPVDLVICWTPDAKVSGGTGQAIRIAHAIRPAPIAVFNLADANQHRAMVEFVNAMEKGNT